MFDAVANVGYLSHLFAGWVGSRGQVYSFDPVPWTFEIVALVRPLVLSTCGGKSLFVNVQKRGRIIGIALIHGCFAETPK